MPRQRDAAQAARWERLKTLTGDLTRVQGVATPDARAIADRIRRDIAAVYRVAGLRYPTVPPVDPDADARLALLCRLLEDLRLETEAVTEPAPSATDDARRNRPDARPIRGKTP